jgi:hypothetical protein
MSSRILLVVVLLVVISTRSALQTGGSTLAHTMTAYGNAQIDTGQSKFGASGLFSGNGAYLSTPDSADWAFGSGDFTIDFWVRFSSTVNEQLMLGQYVDDNNRWFLSKGSDQRLYLYFKVGGVVKGYYLMTSAWSVNANQWYHLTFERSGTTAYIFIDGASQTLTEGLAFGTNDVGDLAAVLTVGKGSGSYYLNGWLDEFRVSKGVARWTSNFTPPSSAYSPDAYTMLLLHMDGTNGSTTFPDDSVFIGPDFSISPSPTSQSVAAGATATYTLSLSASGSYSGSVTLTVTSGCPTDATCSISPNSVSSFPGAATLSVQTAITSGSGTMVITATDGTITHTVSVSLTVVGPASFNFNVKAGATQIVVTLTYGWSGSGAPPQGSITLAGPGANPTLQESGAIVYDRTSIAVSGGSNTYALLHRVTFAITAPGSAQVWTALVSLSGVSTYNVTIEVS